MAGVKDARSYYPPRDCSAAQEWGKALTYTAELPNIFLRFVSYNGQWMEGSRVSRVGVKVVGLFQEGRLGHWVGGGGPLGRRGDRVTSCRDAQGWEGRGRKAGSGGRG